MFYSHDILQKRAGKFGIIWIVATRQSELTRREYMSVRVRKTCDDIMDYIFLRVPGRKAESARPRFSLYLSAQLMFGTIKVFSKQSKYLYDDVAHLMCNLRVSMATTPFQDIDMKLDLTRPNVPEMVGKGDPLSADYDHQFGVWGSLPTEDMRLLEQELFGEIPAMLTPSVKLELSPLMQQTHAEMTAEALKAPNTVGSPDDIKLREDVSTAIDEVQIPGEKELPTFDGKEISIVPEKEMEEVAITLEDLLSPRKTRSRSSSSISDVFAPEEATRVSLPPIPETPPKADKDVKEKEDHPPSPKRRPTSPGVTPIQPEDPKPKRHRVRPSLPMELAPVTPSPMRRRRKRRLQFVDVEMQITKKQLKNNIINSKDTCMPYVLPSTRPSSAEELFARPGQKSLNHPQLLGLWKRNAVTKTNGWTEEEKNDPAWTTTERQEHERRLAEVQAERALMAELPAGMQSPIVPQMESSAIEASTRRSRRLTRQSVDEPEQPRLNQTAEESIEVARGDSALSLESSRLKDVSAEIEKSRQSLEQSHEKLMDESISSRPRSRRGSDQASSSEDLPIDLVPLDLSVQPLATVLEEQEVILPPVLPPDEKVERSPSTLSNHQEEMMRHIEIKTAAKTWTRFHSICGQSVTYKRYAVNMFTALLDLCAQRVVTVQQKEAYEDIFIRRGPMW